MAFIKLHLHSSVLRWYRDRMVTWQPNLINILENIAVEKQAIFMLIK